ncbi:MAG TPA: hypothetical protein VMU94_13265 [Streptosporangiaceae bacterium]|nr:hypothetical protein [Streptosporangiaceae bacterium]
MGIGEEIPCGQSAAPASDHGRLGGYDIGTRTQSLDGLHEAEALVAADSEEIAERYPDVVPAEVRRELRRKHDLYYRVRAHEHAHYYQGTSTAAEVALVFAKNDLTRFLFTALEAAPPGQGIWLPLLRWAMGAAPGCPPDLASVIFRVRAADVLYAALDGDPDVLGRGQVQDNRISRYFPGAALPLSSDIGFRLGRRYLAEGSAKAAEWIYVLRAEPSDVVRAELDLATSPEVYRRAISHVRELIPRIPLLGQLQALVLAADLALHPVIPAGLWPDVYGADPAQAAELAPGPRFASLAGLLPAIPAAAFADKAALAAELTTRAEEDLGWPPADQATRAAIAAIDTVLAAQYHATLLEALEGNSHPIRKMRASLELRLQDRFAFVPPVSAPPINEAQLAASGFRGSTLTPLGDIDRMLAPEERWFSGSLARQLIYAQCPQCPLRGDDSYRTEFLAAGACPALSSGPCKDARSRSAVRHEFLNCDLVRRHLTPHLGSDWRSRLRFFVSSEQPGTFRPRPQRPGT